MTFEDLFAARNACDDEALANPAELSFRRMKVG